MMHYFLQYLERELRIDGLPFPFDIEVLILLPVFALGIVCALYPLIFSPSPFHLLVFISSPPLHLSLRGPLMTGCSCVSLLEMTFSLTSPPCKSGTTV